MMHLRLIRALTGAVGLTAEALGAQLAIPPASVRRLVGELRSYGIGVRMLCGFYTLTGGR